MPDIREIFHDDALPAPLDPAAVTRRARKLRRRERALRSGLAATVVVAVAAVGATLVSGESATPRPQAPPASISPASPPSPSDLPSAVPSPAFPPNPYDAGALAPWLGEWGVADGAVVEYEPLWTRASVQVVGGPKIAFLWQPRYAEDGSVALECAEDLLAVACEARGEELVYLRDYPSGRYLIAERLLPDGTRLAGAVIATGSGLGDPDAELLLDMVRAFPDSVHPSVEHMTPGTAPVPVETASTPSPAPTMPSEVPAYQGDITEPLP